MPRGKGIYDDEGADQSKQTTAQGENNEDETPDVAETDQEPTG
jgi:hypothetical protein